MEFKVEEIKNPSGARIVAVGVGGGGGNMIGHMVKEGVKGIEMIMVNTDSQALDQSDNVKKIQIGAKLTGGLGAGMKPEIGRDSALENYDDIKNALDGADIVFISAGLGGGTGTGAAPVVAQIAKEVGALTVSVVTKPFNFEGKKRAKLAEQGLEELKKESDSIVVIPNEKLLSIIDRRLGIKDSFKIVDSVLAQAVSGTSGVILSSGENDINLDFADLKTVMSHKGMALMGVGEFEGENAAYEAIKAAIESPLLDNMSINGAMGVLVHFKISPNFPTLDLHDAMQVVNETAHEDADIIFGTSTDPELSDEYVKITIVATGFEHVDEQKEEEAPQEVVQQQIEKPVKIKPRLVVGGDFIPETDLDQPAYLRRQQD